jgi:nuclear transport factor 2 (NTF2) superfamily protein
VVKPSLAEFLQCDDTIRALVNRLRSKPTYFIDVKDMLAFGETKAFVETRYEIIDIRPYTLMTHIHRLAV